ncbi:MAG: nucleotidyltransferase domain-containing protein [Anaerolineales bacterium]|nr:nucleotidyltransferase domain-containing protein [Anaerolineales bacterium]
MPTQTGKKNISFKPKKAGEASTRYKVRVKHAPITRQGLIIKKCKETLKKYYGNRLKSVILYGSTARGQSAPASDIDLLVLLSPPLDYFAELRQLVDMLYPIQLESEQLISAKPVSVNDFELGSISLYRNAKREGIAVQ